MITEDITDEEFKYIESFVCSMYTKKKFQSVDELRLDLFLQKYQPKKNEDHFQKFPT